MSGPVQRAERALLAADFVSLGQPVSVAGVPFEFSAVMTSERSLDLVVLIDTIQFGPEDRARRELEGLARALDIAKSRRPLTVVLIGKRWSEMTERAMSRVARVLLCEVVVGTQEQQDAAVQSALAVLLPLRLDIATDEPDESWSTGAREQLEKRLGDKGLLKTLEAAPRGPARVKAALLEFLAEPLGEESDE